MPTTLNHRSPKDCSAGRPDTLPSSSYRFQRSATQDSEQHAACLSDWDQTYNQLESGSFSGELTEVGFEGLQIFREITNRSVVQQGSPLEDCFVIGIPIAMTGFGLFSGRRFTQHDWITFNSRQGFHLITPNRFDVLAITVPKVDLIHLLSIEGFDVSILSRPVVVEQSDQSATELKSLLLSLVSPDRFAPAILENLQVQRDLKSSILTKAVSALSSAQPITEPRRCFRSRSHLVLEIIDWALARNDTPPTILEICLEFNVGRRFLNYAFTDVTGISPLAYLRSMRLNGVRRDLRKAAQNHTVQDVAARWGFFHLPRFSAEYRKLFGELPSETRRCAQHSGYRTDRITEFGTS